MPEASVARAVHVIVMSKEASVPNLCESVWYLLQGCAVYRGETGGLVLTPWEGWLCSYLSPSSVANPYMLFPCDVWV